MTILSQFGSFYDKEELRESILKDVEALMDKAFSMLPENTPLSEKLEFLRLETRIMRKLQLLSDV